ncbi:MAG: hypothetical protein WHS88_10560 [Anaerohalosphaeraceae bacterium]
MLLFTYSYNTLGRAGDKRKNSKKNVSETLVLAGIEATGKNFFAGRIVRLFLGVRENAAAEIFCVLTLARNVYMGYTKCTGRQECRNAGIQEYRYTGIQVYRYSGRQVIREKYEARSTKSEIRNPKQIRSTKYEIRNKTKRHKNTGMQEYRLSGNQVDREARKRKMQQRISGETGFWGRAKWGLKGERKSSK